ncbi:MAG: outer membrane beta-barrel protein [Bacteroidota bacterium]
MKIRSFFRKHTSQVLLLSLLAGGLLAPEAHAQLGIAAGLNFNQLSDIDARDRDLTFDNSTGWHVEVWLDLPLGPVALRPGIRYMDAGSIYEPSDDLGFGVPSVDFDVALLEVPIDVRYRIGTPIISPYIMAGPVLRFPVDVGDDLEDNLESFSLGGSVGVGVEVGLAGIRLYPELKYNFGISRFTDGFEIGGVEFAPDEEQQLSGVMLRLGIGL